MNNSIKTRLSKYKESVSQLKKTASLLALIELKVFHSLLNKPKTSNEIAVSLKLNKEKLEPFLKMVVSMGFLNFKNELYFLIEGDENLLSNDDRDFDYLSYITPVNFKQMFNQLGEIVNIVKTGSSLVSAGAGDDVSKKERFSFLEYLHTRSKTVANEVAAILTQHEVLKMADLGCGAGNYTFSILQKKVNTKAVLVDRENATELIELNAKKYKVYDRIQINPVDVINESFGDNFDLVLVSNFVHCYDEKSIKKLFKTIAGCLVKGGRLAIKDFYYNKEKTGPISAILCKISMAMLTDGGDCYTESQLIYWLKNAGFNYDITYALREAPESYLLVASKK